MNNGELLSSGYYLKEMQNIAQRKRLAIEKKEKYVEYLAKLNKLNGDFPSVITQMRAAEANFENGGYISEGKTLTKGELKTQAEHFYGVQESLQTVIKGTQLEIENITADINELESDYKTAESNYYAALAAEEAAAAAAAKK